MKNVIVGTAGHIDHGKTSLIRALTGANTDRLEEEQKRGISIDLGFTSFELPSGNRAGIIDVPGHEKFIKNMLAGVVGMDVVILVVSADEGLMPQSVEHMNIMDLLGIDKGFIAMSKIDMVEEDWMDLVEEDIRDGVRGTFLEDKPIIRFSSKTGQGLEDVKEEIDKLIQDMEDEDPSGDLPRLPVDRVFSLSGIGTVVTGTLISGVFNLNDEVQIYPSDKTSRLRSIQVHDKDEKVAYKGQRVALNLTDLKTEDAPRGAMIAPPNSMNPTDLVDVKIKTIDNDYIIGNRTRLRMYIGSEEVFGRIILLDRNEIGPDEEALAQIRLEKKIACRRGDRFILRLFSPMITIGGGEILEANPSKKKRYDEEDIKTMELMSSGDSEDATGALIHEHSKDFPSLSYIAQLRSQTEDSLQKDFENLEEKQRIIVVNAGDLYAVSKSFLEDISQSIEKDIKDFHKKLPLRPGISKEEIRSKYFKKTSKRVFDLFLKVISDNSKIEDKNEYLALEGFNLGYTEEQEKIKDKILEEFNEERFANPRLDEIFTGNKPSKDEINEVFNSLLIGGQIQRLPQGVFLKNEDLNFAVKKIIEFLQKNKEITLADARDYLGTSRKICLAILEHMDNEKITKRSDDVRILV